MLVIIIINVENVLVQEMELTYRWCYSGNNGGVFHFLIGQVNHERATRSNSRGAYDNLLLPDFPPDAGHLNTGRVTPRATRNVYHAPRCKLCRSQFSLPYTRTGKPPMAIGQLSELADTCEQETRDKILLPPRSIADETQACEESSIQISSCLYRV